MTATPRPRWRRRRGRRRLCRVEVIKTGPNRFVGEDATLHDGRVGGREFVRTLPAATHAVWRRRRACCGGGTGTEPMPIFLHIPKTAGCSLATGPDAGNSLLWFGHVFAREFPKCLWPRLRTVVRNPFDRFVSAYFWVLDQHSDLSPESDLAAAIADRLGLVVGLSRRTFDPCAAAGKQHGGSGAGGVAMFEDWVLLSERGPSRWRQADVRWSRSGCHESRAVGAVEVFLRQTEWLVAASGAGDSGSPGESPGRQLSPSQRPRRRRRVTLVVSPDRIGRFENIATEAQRLFGLSSLPHLNATPRLPWTSYFRDAGVCDVVRRLYGRDFALLGYSRAVPVESAAESGAVAAY